MLFKESHLGMSFTFFLGNILFLCVSVVRIWASSVIIKSQFEVCWTGAKALKDILILVINRVLSLVSSSSPCIAPPPPWLCEGLSNVTCLCVYVC